jgi:hypothetical protein
VTCPAKLRTDGKGSASLEKAGDFAPTLVPIKRKNGTECGGVAAVPRPSKYAFASDPARGSCVFSLGATPAHLDPFNPEQAFTARTGVSGLVVTAATYLF